MPHKFSKKTLQIIIISYESVGDFIDDILVYGSTKKEHDQRVEKVMEV